MKKEIDKKTLIKAYELMCSAVSMTELYEENKTITSKYVHATSRGHEAIQLAVSMQLKPCDFLAPYYRDDSMLLGIGMRPFDLMLQLLGKKNDPFSGGRTYYSHPSLKDDDKPKIPHQSSATGMQAIPTTGLAMGIQYLEQQGLNKTDDKPVVVCSLGDACVTEGEVSEAFHMAALKQIPIIFVVQDNEWDISAHAREIRTQNAYEYAQGFKGLEALTIDGTDFVNSYRVLEETIKKVRTERRPFLIHAEVPLLNHHTSGVRMEWYRDDLKEQRKRDPFPKFKAQLKELGIGIADLINVEARAKQTVEADYQLALKEEDPSPADLFTHDFAPTPITEEKGERSPAGKEPTVMVDSALFAVQELLGEVLPKN